jgi:outer membrane protein TolC
VSLALELPLTLFDHGQGESARAEADAQLLRAQAQRLKRRNAVAVRAGLAALAQLRAALPEAHAAVRDVVAAREKALQLYAAGEASITELLDAFRAAEEAELLRLDLVQDVALTRLAVMRAAGTHFNVTLDRECRDGNAQGQR